MRVVAVLAQKGGSGKTTLATNLGAASQSSGLATVIYDLDPQGTASSWGDARDGEAPEVQAVQPSRLTRMVEKARTIGTQLIIIDTAPHTSDAAAEAAMVSDLILVPCRPTSFDLSSLPRTLRTCELAGKEAWVVLNSVPPSSRVGDEAYEALVKAKINVLPHRLGQRMAYVNPLGNGRSAAEWEPQSRAASEIQAVWKWLSNQLRM